MLPEAKKVLKMTSICPYDILCSYTRLNISHLRKSLICTMFDLSDDLISSRLKFVSFYKKTNKFHLWYFFFPWFGTLGLFLKLSQWLEKWPKHFRLSVKHVLGVLEWFCMPTEKHHTRHFPDFFRQPSLYGALHNMQWQK